MLNRSFRPFLVVAAVVCFAPANTLAQHVHGVIELGVVVEGSTVAVSLNAPLSDVVGFEYAPRSDEEVGRVWQAAAVLSNPNDMFKLSSAANCSSSGSSVSGPGYLDRHLDAVGGAAAAQDDDHHDDDHHGHDDGHHDDHHGSDEDHSDHHDHEGSDDHGDEHAEVIATYEWACANPSNLDTLELRFIDGFANVGRIEVQILTSAGARLVTAGGSVRSVSLEAE